MKYHIAFLGALIMSTIAYGQNNVTFMVSDGKMVFYISFVGYEGVSVRLTFPEDNNRTLEVELEEMEEELDEVVISATRSSRTIIDIPTRIEVIGGTGGKGGHEFFQHWDAAKRNHRGANTADLP